DGTFWSHAFEDGNLPISAQTLHHRRPDVRRQRLHDLDRVLFGKRADHLGQVLGMDTLEGVAEDLWVVCALQLRRQRARRPHSGGIVAHRRAPSTFLDPLYRAEPRTRHSNAIRIRNQDTPAPGATPGARTLQPVEESLHVRPRPP